MDLKYIVNESAPSGTLEDPRRLLAQTLERIVVKLPPRDDYPVLKGLWAGPNGFACLFLLVSSRYPDLEIGGQLSSALWTGPRDT